MKYRIFNCCTRPMPFEPRPEGYNNPIWRSQHNPIINRNYSKDIIRIYNSGVIEYGDGYIGVFRGEDLTAWPGLYLGRSRDGVNWDIDSKKLELPEVGTGDLSYGYDPRLLKIEDTYYIVWCTDIGGPTIAIAKTSDFVRFERLRNGFLPYNRNGVLFPEKINGKFYMMSRPSDDKHTAFGDIFISESSDMEFWGNHRLLMKNRTARESWSALKIGAGPVPIKTSEGWLIIYHGVLNSCNGFVYSVGAALAQLDDPSKIIARSEKMLMTPEMWYEERGFVPNVIFPCAALCDSEGRLAIYYGAADTYLALAFSTVDIVIDFIKENNCIQKGE